MTEQYKSWIASSVVVLLLVAHLTVVSCSSPQDLPYYSSNGLRKRSIMAVNIVPRGLCWEYAEGSTFAFWSYNNDGGDITVENGPTNQFSINGARLETNMPPINFTGGEIKNSATLAVNLGPTGLVFAWTISDQAAILNGSDLTHNCPTIAMSVLLECTSTPPNPSSLIPYLSLLIPINESRIAVETVDASAGYAAAVLISIAPAMDQRSSVWASNQLFKQLSTSSSVKNDMETILGTTIGTYRVDTTGISDVNPLPPPPPPKYEMRAGTLVGIVFASVFGTTLLIIAIFTVIFRVSAYLEEKRMNRLANSYYGESKPLINMQPDKPSGKSGVTSVRI